jgi:hypothetical protein
MTPGAAPCHTAAEVFRMTRIISVALWFTLAAAAFGQAAVEAGLGASRAATSTAPAKGLGKSMSGLAGSLDKAFKPAVPEAAEAPSPAASTAVAPAALPKPAVKKYEDVSAIEPGIPYAELIRRFGPPAISMTFDGETTLSYTGARGPSQVKLVAGFVKTVEQPQP